jgi:hypothetical protein
MTSKFIAAQRGFTLASSSQLRSIGANVGDLVPTTTLTLAAPPTETYWTADLMARASGVRRIWKVQGLQPHPCRQFKLSNDPN